jgi:hypothetical protein
MILHTDHRGQTAGGRYTYRPLVEYEPNDFPPDSLFWKNTAEDAMDRLRELLGVEYPLWAELTWPGTSIQEFTWYDLAQMSLLALGAYKMGKTDPKVLAAEAWAALGMKND